MTKVAKSMDALNTEQYRELQEEIGAVNPAALEGLTDQTDWFDEVYKTGQTQNYQVSVSNGNEKMKYFLSAGYLNEKAFWKARTSNDIASVPTLTTRYAVG